MDKPLLPLKEPENNLHNISVMFFLFFSESQTFITPVTEKNISDMAFSPYDFSQKIQMNSGKKIWQKNLSDYSGYFNRL